MILIEENFLPKAIELIQSAKKSVEISTFKAQIIAAPRGRRTGALFEALYAKKSQGVRVRVLMNWHENPRNIPEANVKTLSHLQKNRIEVRVLPRNRCCHAKLILVDDRTAIIGSHNLSIASLTQNFEISAYLTEPQSVFDLIRAYNAKWDTAEPPKVSWQAKI